MSSPNIIGQIPTVLNKILSNATNVFMLITVPLYIMVLYIIARNRKDSSLKHSFFSIIISLGVADIAKIIWTTFYTNPAGYGWFPQFYLWIGSSLASRIQNTLSWGLTGAQIAGLFFITLNRFTATAFPMRHHNIWNDGKVLLYCIVVQWIFAVAMAMPYIVSTQCFYSSLGANGTITFGWDGAVMYDFYVISFIIEPIVLIIIILYVIIFVSVIRKKRKNGGISTHNEKVALRMSLIGLTHVLGLILVQHVILAANYAWIWFQANLFQVDTFWFLVNEGGDFFSVVNPYALLIFCSPIRKRLLQMFRKTNKIQTTIHSIALEQRPTIPNLGMRSSAPILVLS